MKKVYFEEESSDVRPLRRFGLWVMNVGVFILLAAASAVAICLTAALL